MVSWRASRIKVLKCQHQRRSVEALRTGGNLFDLEVNVLCPGMSQAGLHICLTMYGLSFSVNQAAANLCVRYSGFCVRTDGRFGLTMLFAAGNVLLDVLVMIMKQAPV